MLTKEGAMEVRILLKQGMSIRDVCHAGPFAVPFSRHQYLRWQLSAEGQSEIRRIRKERLGQVGQFSLADQYGKWVTFQLSLTCKR
jgi:hypothetical protein